MASSRLRRRFLRGDGPPIAPKARDANGAVAKRAGDRREVSAKRRRRE